MRLGFIDFKKDKTRYVLDDIWFMVGSKCNLACSHCYVGSSPYNNTLEQLTFADVKKFVDEATFYSLKNIYLTGGEPFINKDIISIISYCIKKANITILTNATFPIKRHIKTLKEIKDKARHELILRISLDHYDEKKHDKIRSAGSFALTVENTLNLLKAGFNPIITTTAVVYEEDNELSEKQIEKKFHELFGQYKIKVKILPFNLEMGSNLNRIKKKTAKVIITQDCMNKPGIKKEDFQCYNGRTIQKIDGKLRIYPCPIIYNEEKYELGYSLKESFQKVYLTHKACYDFCYKSGGKCTN